MSQYMTPERLLALAGLPVTDENLTRLQESVVSKSKYKVTFNNGDFGIGDEHLATVDYIGFDIAELAEEVIADSPPSEPLEFRPGSFDGHADVVGVFVDSTADPEDQYPIAVMYS